MATKQLWCTVIVFIATSISGDCVEFWRYPQLNRNRPTGSVPYVRPIKSHVNNFFSGETGRVTVVYRSDVELDVRWFRKADGLTDAEIDNMLSIEGDEAYEVTSAGSGDVRATTLIWTHVGSDFPYKFITSFSVNDTFYQYQYDTVIQEETASKTSPSPPLALRQMYWVTVPQPWLSFTFRGRFRVKCAAILAAEASEDDAALHMYSTVIEPSDEFVKYGQLVSKAGETMSRGRPTSFAQSPGNYQYRGRRTQLPLGYVKYELEVTVRNASREDQGMYVCGLERSHDRTFVNTWVRKRTLEGGPLVEILPCRGRASHRRAEPFPVYMTVNETNCFSCRASGYPPPIITVLRNNQPIGTSEHIHVHSHVNVAYGGIPEVTYTYFRPRFLDSGDYRCRASSNGQTAYVNFTLDVLPKQ